jgi:hypothetical protein
MIQMWIYTLLIVPAVVAALALRTGHLPYKMGVPALCALIVATRIGGRPGLARQIALVAPVIGAFLCSMIGDYFLSNKGSHEHFFVYGIAAYLLAHLGYLAYALRHGRPSWVALAVLLAGYLAYYALKLRPAVEGTALSLSVLAYLLVSCLALAAAWGVRLPALPKGLYVAGLALIVLSDTIISFTEFLGYRALNGLILPTYYLAQIAITASVLVTTYT